jgi:hypothetical protein
MKRGYGLKTLKRDQKEKEGEKGKRFAKNETKIGGNRKGREDPHR